MKRLNNGQRPETLSACSGNLSHQGSFPRGSRVRDRLCWRAPQLLVDSCPYARWFVSQLRHLNPGVEECRLSREDGSDALSAYAPKRRPESVPSSRQYSSRSSTGLPADKGQDFSFDRFQHFRPLSNEFGSCVKARAACALLRRSIWLCEI
jgi:hypothetical protein